MKPRILRHGMKIIFAQALIAMLGSLYYGFYGDPFSGDFFNSANALEPCELCRYARILMYPLVFFSGVALIKKQTKIVDYFIPFCVL